MSAGIPVVATAVGGLLEVVEEGGTGLLVPADDPVALAEAIDRVVDEPDLAGRLTGRARVVAEARFSPASMASAYETLYEEFAQKDGA